MVIQHYEGLYKMKKIISVMSVLALLFSNQIFAEQDKVSVEVCKEGAISEGISSELMKEYIDKCVEDIAADEKREEMETQKGS